MPSPTTTSARIPRCPERAERDLRDHGGDGIEPRCPMRSARAHASRRRSTLALASNPEVPCQGGAGCLDRLMEAVPCRTARPPRSSCAAGARTERDAARRVSASRSGLAAPELANRVRARFTDDEVAHVEALAPDLQRIRSVCKIDLVGALHPRRQARADLGERGLRPGRQHEQLVRTHAFGGGRARALLEHDVHVRPADAQRADACTSRRRLSRMRFKSAVRVSVNVMVGSYSAQHGGKGCRAAVPF
jgi:hypothetical protein